MKKVMLLLILMGVIQSSFANSITARELNETCYNYPFSAAHYVAGVYEGIDLTVKRTGKFMTVGTLTDLFKREMILHPEKGDLSAGYILTSLLIKHKIYKF